MPSETGALRLRFVLIIFAALSLDSSKLWSSDSGTFSLIASLISLSHSFSLLPVPSPSQSVFEKLVAPFMSLNRLSWSYLFCISVSISLIFYGFLETRVNSAGVRLKQTFHSSRSFLFHLYRVSSTLGVQKYRIIGQHYPKI